MTTLYAASKEFITLATDTPANQPFLGTLRTPITLERSIIGTSGFGEISIGFGEIELINTDADYDAYIGVYGIDGQQVTMKIGATISGVVGPYSGFATLANLTATGWTINEDNVIIALRDNSYKLEVPTQPNTYAGTGDIEGGVDLQGKRKPIVVGQVRNISPPLLIPAELVYQVHDGPIEELIYLYDGAGQLVSYGDYADSTLMRAAGISDGYVTCLAEGMVMLGASPFGKITADVLGDDSGGYIRTTADIVTFLVLNATDLVLTDIDLASVDEVNLEQPADIGYYLNTDSNETVAETIAKLMAGINGWVAFDPVGKLQLHRVKAPTLLEIQSYDQFDFISISLDRLPSGIDPIIKTARVAYNPNWTLQQGTELIGYVLETYPDLVSYLATPYRVAVPSTDNSAVIEASHPLAIDPDIFVSYFVEEYAAIAEADSRMALYGVERSMYRFVTKEHMFAQEVGDTIYVIAPRLGLSTGKHLLVVSVRDDLNSAETEVVGFG